MPRVFISHSSRDKELASHLVSLLRTALNLSASDIRCTSVAGYGLRAGSRIDDTLRREVLDAEVFVGLLTRSSRESSYVLFELGARWGAERDLIPLISPGSDGVASFGPLADLHALRCDNRAQMYQFVEEVSIRLGVELEKTPVYQAWIEKVSLWSAAAPDDLAEPFGGGRKPEPSLKDRVRRRGSVYYLIDPGENQSEGPFCPACLEAHDKLITVHEVTRPFNLMGDVRCRVCKSFYKLSPS